MSGAVMVHIPGHASVYAHYATDREDAMAQAREHIEAQIADLQAALIDPDKWRVNCMESSHCDHPGDQCFPPTKEIQ